MKNVIAVLGMALISTVAAQGHEAHGGGRVGEGFDRRTCRRSFAT